MLDPRRRSARRRSQRQRLVVAVIVAAASSASVAHALTDQHKPRLRCATHPVACEKALVWQKTQRRRLAREVRELRAHLRRVHTPTVREAALLAGQALHVDPHLMLRVGMCETGRTLDPYAYNEESGALGWMQFLASTWRHTPFAAWPRTNPYAEALAAAQIVRADGGYHQWSCRP